LIFCVDLKSNFLLQIDKYKAKGAMKEIGIAKVGSLDLALMI